MFNARTMAMNMLANNPAIANNPQAMEYIRTIQNGDSKRGQEIANNLCSTYGISKEEVVKRARQMFGMPM